MARSRSDLRYYERRAEVELEQAQAAGHPNAVRAHYHLAGHYLDLIHGETEPRPINEEV
jgi:hypothetical protein